MPDPAQHRLASRYGALKSWANTPDRSARTRPARSKSPASLDYWLNKLDPERFAAATAQQRLDAADAMRRAHYTQMALKSAAVRSNRGSAA